MALRDEALELHRKNRGKIEVRSKIQVTGKEDLSLAYTPGVAEACLEIARDKDLAYEYTFKGNLIGILSDGTAVLGLGDIYPLAALPVMEGKSLLFKMMGGVDAIPLCVSTKNVNDIVQIVKWLEPTLGGLNMEDISAPRCFEIEKRLIEEVHIPIFHDDQHGTAIVVLSALINATKVVSKDLSKIKVVISGAGAAGIAVADLLLNSGVPEVLVCDSKGAVYPGRQEGMNPFKEDIAVRGNIHGIKGSLAEALKGADALVGVSAGGIVSTDMIREMRAGAIVIAMANPVPEIYPAEAKAGGAAVVGTGRSDFPNQVNNVLAFPGILRGALDVRAKRINEEMRVAAARAIAELITDSELSADYIIPDPFDKRVAPHVASAVAKAAIRSGVAQADVDPDLVYSRTIDMTK